jgi:YVTN family beta-propeller protein
MRLHGGLSGSGAGRSIGVLATVAAVCCVAASPAAAASKVINTIAVGRTPFGVSADGTHVWVANSGSNTVSEIEASTGTLINTIHVGSAPFGVSSDGTHVWVTNAGENTVSEIATNTSAIRCSKLYGGATNVTFGLCKPSAGKGYTRLRGAISGLQVGATGFTWSPGGATTELEVTSATPEHHEACKKGQREEQITGEIKAASTTGTGIPAVGETFTATICTNPKTHKAHLLQGTYVEL